MIIEKQLKATYPTSSWVWATINLLKVGNRVLGYPGCLCVQWWLSVPSPLTLRSPSLGVLHLQRKSVLDQPRSCDWVWPARSRSKGEWSPRGSEKKGSASSSIFACEWNARQKNDPQTLLQNKGYFALIQKIEENAIPNERNWSLPNVMYSRESIRQATNEETKWDHNYLSNYLNKRDHSIMMSIVLRIFEGNRIACFLGWFLLPLRLLSIGSCLGLQLFLRLPSCLSSPSVSSPNSASTKIDGLHLFPKDWSGI